MANEKHIEIIKQGANVWNQWRQDSPNLQPDLSDADLLRSNLCGVDLSYANLQQANFYASDLSSADLRHADLSVPLGDG